jgi:hypothetical protein
MHASEFVCLCVAYNSGFESDVAEIDEIEQYIRCGESSEVALDAIVADAQAKRNAPHIREDDAHADHQPPAVGAAVRMEHPTN